MFLLLPIRAMVMAATTCFARRSAPAPSTAAMITVAMITVAMITVAMIMQRMPKDGNHRIERC
ncbi:MAG: hypothetical protein CMJ72_15480 [Planctomycetaceae bacterium]|nr:hypothetical protein [Planctomycetaceae bacterium]|tara:strand:- start:258 stop:446 length:189 start_codon:yes stop_codon:yes gene_type:complete